MRKDVSANEGRLTSLCRQLAQVTSGFLRQPLRKDSPGPRGNWLVEQMPRIKIVRLVKIE